MWLWLTVVERTFDDFCKLLEEKKDYVKLLADRGLQLEVWFEVEMYKSLSELPSELGIIFRTEEEYPQRKGWFVDLTIEKAGQRDFVEVKVRLLSNGSRLLLTRRMTEAFDRLYEGIKDKTIRKWCLVIAYPLPRDSKLAETNEESAKFELVKRRNFSFDETSDCLVLLYRIS